MGCLMSTDEAVLIATFLVAYDAHKIRDRGVFSIYLGRYASSRPGLRRLLYLSSLAPPQAGNPAIR